MDTTQQSIDLYNPATWPTPPDPLWPGFPRIGSPDELMAVAMGYKNHLASVRLFASLLRDAMHEDVPDDVFASDFDRRPKSRIIEDDPYSVYVSLKMAVGSEDEVEKRYPRVHENYERYCKHELGCIMLGRALSIAAEQRGIDSSAIDNALHTRDENVVQCAFDAANRLCTIADAEQHKPAEKKKSRRRRKSRQTDKPREPKKPDWERWERYQQLESMQAVADELGCGKTSVYDSVEKVKRWKEWSEQGTEASRQSIDASASLDSYGTDAGAKRTADL